MNSRCYILREKPYKRQKTPSLPPTKLSKRKTKIGADDIEKIKQEMIEWLSQKVMNFLLNSKEKKLGALENLITVPIARQNHNCRWEMNSEENVDKLLTTQSTPEWIPVIPDSSLSTLGHKQQYHYVAPALGKTFPFWKYYCKIVLKQLKLRIFHFREFFYISLSWNSNKNQQ